MDRLDGGIGSGCREMKLVINLMCHFWKTEVAGCCPSASRTSSSYRDAQSWGNGDLLMSPEQPVTAVTALQQSAGTQPCDSPAGHLRPGQKMALSPARFTLVTYRAVRAGVCCPFLEEMCYRSILAIQKPEFSAISPDWQSFLCCD